MAQIPITNGFYISESLPLSHQQCTNVFPSVADVPALSQEFLRGTAGIDELATSGAIEQVNRGSWRKGDLAYAVNGNTLYRVDKTVVDGADTFSYVSLGSVSGVGRVSLASSETQLMVLVPGGAGYIYNEDDATPFQEITDADFRANGNPLHVAYIDSVFVCTTDDKKIIHSALNDGLAWNALDFGEAESDPDAAVAPVVVNNQLFITGTLTTEGFKNIGGSGFIFKRSNIFLDKGCVAPFTLVKTNQTFLMVGKGLNETPAIWMFNGNSFTKKSTKAIDKVISSYSQDSLENSFAMYSGLDGDFFVYFTFPDRTFVYNLATDKWHEQKTCDSSGEDSKWRVNSMIDAYGRTLVFDSIDGRVGELTYNSYKEYGCDIKRVFSLAPFFDLEGVEMPHIELTMESGVGNADVEDPKVAMAVSLDGVAFKNDRARSIGKVGASDGRIIWRRNGGATKIACLRFTMTDAVKPIFIRLDAL